MDITKSFRKLHRRAAPIIFLPLILTATTAVIHRIAKYYFHIPNRKIGFLISIHHGRYLGELEPIYVLLVACGLVGMVVTGVSLVKNFVSIRAKSKRWRFDVRTLHGVLAPLIGLPLLVSALTGLIYRVQTTWLGVSAEDARIWMKIHQASILGSYWRPIYVIFLGTGLISLLITGILMTGIFRKRR